MEHVALYRQFRPMDFDEIVEQKAPVATLRQSVISKRIGHAYLFCGQRGTGKTSIARVFSRAINCESPVNGNPCNKCPTCKGILDGSLMDVIEIDAASNRSIDNIRKICEEVTYAPSKAPYKVYIIDEVHMITTDAFNALLKTLEEPPKHAVFLFATTEPHQIPATILSRCQRFDFRRISQEAIAGRLGYICEKEGIKADGDALTLIASLSDGAMRDAISMLDQAASSASGKTITAEDIEDMTGSVNKTVLADMAQILIDGRFDDLLTKCREVADSGRDLTQFTLDLAGYFRDLLVVRMMPDPTSLVPASPTTLKRMYEIASTTNSNTLIAFVSGLSKTVSELKWSPSVRTSFEVTLLRMCGRKIKADEVPLVIPDFSKKQKEAAERISSGASSAPSTSAVPAAPAVEDRKEENNDTSSGAASDNENDSSTSEDKAFEEQAVSAEETGSEAPVKEEKTSDEAASKAESPAPDKERLSGSSVIGTDNDPLSSIRARLDSMKNGKKQSPFDKSGSTADDKKDEDKKSELPPIARMSEEKKPEPSDEDKKEDIKTDTDETADTISEAVPDDASEGPADPASAAPAKAPEEPADPEDIPMENQMDIFSFSSAPSSESAESPAPKAAEPLSGKEKKGGIFADISDSFFDDVRPNEEQASREASYDVEPGEDSDIYAPTDRIGETKKTKLTAMLETTPIAETRSEPAEGADTDAIWETIITRASDSDFILYQLLSQASFRTNDNLAFIVFADSDAAMIDSIKKEPKFKRISSDIRKAIPGIEKVFLSTERQYRNAIRSVTAAEAPEDSPAMSKAEDFISRSSQAGINTEIHFGDD